MPTLKTRLARLEDHLHYYCQTCGRSLHCAHCGYAKDVRECPDEALEALVRDGMRRLGKNPEVFLNHGYDLHKLTVAELHTLRTLLLKAGESPLEP